MAEIDIEQAVEQQQLTARFVYGDPLPATLAGGSRALLFGRPEPEDAREIPWDPEAVGRAFRNISLLFKLAQQMMAAEHGLESTYWGEIEWGEVDPAWLTSVLSEPHEFDAQVLHSYRQSRRVERKPLEVVRITLGSLEVLLVVSGILATPKVLHNLFALIEEAYTIRPRIRRDRATHEAERLAAELEAMQTKQEMVRLAARTLDPAGPRPTAVEFWLGNGERPPFERGPDR